MNRNIEPSSASVVASVWFMKYLQDKLGDKDENERKLAEAIGMERKAILAYALGYRSPKLEVVAKIMDYYGDTVAVIPLDPSLELEGNRCSKCGRITK